MKELTPMAKITPIRITGQFQHFVADLQDSFWGDLYGRTRLAWKQLWEAQSARVLDGYMQSCWYDHVRPPRVFFRPVDFPRAGRRDARRALNNTFVRRVRR